MTSKLLVIDDDEPWCKLLHRLFTSEGLAVIMEHDGRPGVERARTERPDVILLDLDLPVLGGLDALPQLLEANPNVPVIMQTGNQDARTAVRAMQLGAFDYLPKPIDNDELVLVVRRALEARALRIEVADLRRRVGEVEETVGLAAQMGGSAEVQAIVEHVRTVATSNFSVLILGETGTGKELVAQSIHRESDRRARPFIALDCGAIPETLLESELFGHERGAFTGADRRRPGQFHLAEGGTLFLDEIGNLPIALQAKLLRALESRQVQTVGAAKATPVDIRFVAATNQNLQDHVARGSFRSDLYFRLAQYTISLPLLRERPSDIPYLAQRFLEEASVELRRPVNQIPPDVARLLQRHSWPGTVRELRNTIRRAVLESKDLQLHRGVVQRLLGETSEQASLRPPGIVNRSLREVATEAAREAERQAISAALRAAGGNKAQAARALQTDYKTLHTKMAALGIRGRDFTP
jgi:two-component system nitrogen regulation response regulator GlnG